MSERILLSEWAPADPLVPLGHSLHRSPCPVCGHPTGDCTTDHTTEARIIMAEQKKGAAGANKQSGDELQTDTAPAPAAPEGDEAVLVKRGEGDGVSDSLFEKTEAGEEFVTLGKDVVEEFYYPGTKRPAYRVLFTKGQVVRRSVVEAYNARDERDEKNPLGIDSSTLASGTRVEPVKDDEGK